MGKEGFLSSFSKDFSVSHTATYRWVKKYKKELEDADILTEKRKGGRKYLYVNDLDKFLSFFKEKGVYLVED